MKFKWYEKLVMKLATRTLGRNVENKEELKFEKDLLKLLEEYGLFERNNKTILQKAIISVEVGKCPKTDLTLFNLKHKSKPID